MIKARKPMAYLTASMMLFSSIAGMSSTILAQETTQSGLSYSFDKDSEGWIARGDAQTQIKTESQGLTNKSGDQCLFVTGRSQGWHGIQKDLTDKLQKGQTYTFGLWVKYTEGNQTEELKLTLENGGANPYITIASNSGVKKGEWTYLSGKIAIPNDIQSANVYVEATNPTLNFYLDALTIDGSFESANNTSKLTTAIEQDIPSLKDEYKDYFKFGTAISSNHLNDLEQELTAKHFNSITCENAMKPEAMLDYDATIAYMKKNGNDQTHPQVSLSADARAILDFASAHDIPVRGHVLVWHSQTPNWLFTKNYSKAANAPLVSKEIMLKRLENYITAVFKTLATEYPDVNFYAFDVVNEAINPDTPNGLRAAAKVATTSGDDGNNENANLSMWMTTIGEEHIEKAFVYARAAANKYLPNTKLAYNDYNECDSKKSDLIYKLCKKLYDKGLLDIVGMQGHYSMTSPSPAQFEDAIRKYASIGKNIEIQITELDITQADYSEESLLKQAYRYKTFFDIMKKLENEKAANITSCVVWGVKDDESWRSDNLPLLFDKDYKAKPAFWAITDASKLPVLSQEVKAYSTVNNEVEQAFLVQNGTLLQSSDGTELATFKVAWDSNNIYVNVVPKNNLKGKKGTITLFVEDAKKNVSLAEGSFIKLPLSNKIAIGDKISFDLSIQVDGQIATWNNIAYDGTAQPDKAAFGKLLITFTPKLSTALKGTPTIDGNIDKLWDNAKTINVNTFSVGQSGATATAKALWDENYIYVLMEVKDPLLSKKSADTYQQDSVEIFIDEDNAKSNAYELGDIQYRVNFDNERSINGASDANSFITATKTTKDGYIAELALPYRISIFKPNAIIGFDLQVNDDADGDGTRDNVANWNDLTGNGWSSTENYGILQLISE